MEIIQWIIDEKALEEFMQERSTLLLFGFIVAFIYLLSRGAGWLVDGVVSLARRTNIPEVVIGATVVSLGTTTPEAFVSVMAAFTGDSGLALGNGVGSIIADTGLIFGLVCILAAVPMNRFILNRTGWVQLGSAVLLTAISVFLYFSTDGKPVLGRWVGILFIALLIGYLYITCIWAKKSGKQLAIKKETDKDSVETRSLVACWLMIIGGLAVVIISARLLIPSAKVVADRFGVSQDIIAVTMVAFGTSLPELVTAIVSVRKGHPEISVGNIVGADVLNCLFVIGAAACAKPLEVPLNFFIFHFPVMLIILFSFRFFIFMNREGRFRRWQGVWLLFVYVIYIAMLFSLDIFNG